MSADALRYNAQKQFRKELQQWKDSDSKKKNQLALELEIEAKSINCFYCLDYKVVYKDREGMFASMDGRGNYDIINCKCCKGNDGWVSCSSGPESKYPGICKRGTRDRHWIEMSFDKHAQSLIDQLAKKAGNSI